MPRGVYERTPEIAARIAATRAANRAARKAQPPARPSEPSRQPEAITAPTDPLHDAIVGVLVAAIRDSRVREALMAAMRPTDAPQPPVILPEPPAQPAERLAGKRRERDTCVLIAGPKGHQMKEIEDRCRGLGVRLRFWKSDEALEQLRRMAPGCEVAIGMVDFISHPADAILKAKSPHYIRQNGGIGRMADAVINYLKEH